jgi:putative membrane protein
MEQERSLTSHYFLRAGILIGFAMYIIYLVKTDNILYYIAPRMVVYVKLSAIGFYAIAIYQIYVAFSSLWGKQALCDCEHPPSRSLIRNTTAYSLFLLPLLLGFIMPDSAMGSSLAAKRGVTLNTSQTQAAGKLPNSSLSSSQHNTASDSSADQSANDASAGDAQLKALFKADKYDEGYAQIGMRLYKKDLIEVKEDGFMEILSSLDLFLDRFIGKKMEISGFVYREEAMNSSQFVVARFSVQCCSADASPFGVMVQFAKGQTLAKDSWVKVTGTIAKSKYNGNDVLTLVADKVERISPSKKPYVYPNYDYVGN